MLQSFPQFPPCPPVDTGDVIFSGTPPPNPVPGTFWWDSLMLHLFDGAVWVNIGPSPGGGSVGTVPPQNPAPGTIWWNGTIAQIWDGGYWRLVGGAIVSSVAPANPAVGEQWWNGAVLKVWDGAAWQSTQAAVTQGIQFAVTATTAHVIVTTGWSIIPLTDAPQIDLMGGWNSATYQWTPNVPGTYIFLLRGLSDGIALLKNDPGSFTGGASYETVTAIATQAVGTGAWITATGAAQMNGTTDFVRMFAKSAAGTFPAVGGNPCFSAGML